MKNGLSFTCILAFLFKFPIKTHFLSYYLKLMIEFKVPTMTISSEVTSSSGATQSYGYLPTSEAKPDMIHPKVIWASTLPHLFTRCRAGALTSTVLASAHQPAYSSRAAIFQLQLA